MCGQGFSWQHSRSGWLVGRFETLQQAGAVHAFTTRAGPDVNAVRADPANAARLVAAELELDGAAWARQVHGPDVVVVERQIGRASCRERV